MKRYISMVLALCLVAALSVPALALEIDNKGWYRVRGFGYKNLSFNDQDKDTDTKYDHMLRMDHKLTISDDVKLSFRWSAFDVTWGQENLAVAAPAAQYDTVGGYQTFIMNRAWITYKSKIGLFDVGRMIGGAWGLPFGDYEGDFDRIKYTVPVGDKVALIGIYQKGAERDIASKRSDTDTDVFYLVGNYKAEAFSTGLLTAHVRNHSNEASEQNYYAAVPYFNGKFGPIGVLFEVGYEFGRFEDERVKSAQGNDMAIGALTLGAEINGQHGPMGWELGYGQVDGQDARRLSGNDRKFTFGNFAYGGLGEDWDKLVYLTDTSGTALLTNYGSYQGAVTVLPGTVTSATMPAFGGARILYLGASFKPKENLKLSVLGGVARALEYDCNPRTSTYRLVLNPATGTLVSDNRTITASQRWQGAEYGKEIDFRLSWDITPNLNYGFNFGWLFAGDAMGDVMGVNKNNVEDGCKVYHKLQVSF